MRHFQNNETLKTCHNCRVIAAGWEIEKGLGLGPSLQSRIKNRLKIFSISNANISPSFILKQDFQETIKMYLLWWRHIFWISWIYENKKENILRIKHNFLWK